MRRCYKYKFPIWLNKEEIKQATRRGQLYLIRASSVSGNVLLNLFQVLKISWSWI